MEHWGEPRVNTPVAAGISLRSGRAVVNAILWFKHLWGSAQHGLKRVATLEKEILGLQTYHKVHPVTWSFRGRRSKHLSFGCKGRWNPQTRSFAKCFALALDDD
jgi:hypothetical protein